ncbi:MAG TPA: hypothetical protein PK867_20115 [Pirellulales bacterium]|nr:hypothetical protein [Pirellulales bacterium]
MATYRFEARDAAGEQINDVIVAPSEEEARATIRQWGCFITKITDASDDESLSAIRELGERCCVAKGGARTAGTEATERPGAGRPKRLSFAQTLKDYLVVAAIVGAILVVVVAFGTQLETALYVVPFLAFAVVACQYWLRWQLSPTGAVKTPARILQPPNAPREARAGQESPPRRAMRFGLLSALVLALCLLAALLTIFGPTSR